MNFYKPVFFVVVMFCVLSSEAQKRITVSGYVKDSLSGENLSGASLNVAGMNVITVSNSYGFYSVSLPKGSYKFEYSYVGYSRAERELRLERDTVVDVTLSMFVTEMSEAVVSPGRASESVNRPVNVSPLSISSVRLLPPLLGEADLIRSFQLLPGVSSIGDGASGFNVRGGGIDQNLVLQDEAPLYFTSHLFSLFSVANPDAVKDASLYKTDMPARFGGRLSSVLDLRLKDGNNKEWGFTGGLGLIASRITAEGPLIKNKSSIIVSARRSYTDLITRQSSDPEINQNSIYFYDLSTKLNIAISDRDKLFVSAYFGKDKIQAEKNFHLKWGNGTSTVRWNHVFNPKLFQNTSLIYSDYKYQLGSANNPSNSFLWKAGINDYTVKSSFNWYPDNRSNINFGLETVLHDFSPGKAEPGGSESLFDLIQMPGQRSAEYHFYWDHELSFTRNFAVEYGIRYSVFQSLAKGESTVYEYEGPAGQRKDAVNPRTFNNWESIKTYHLLQPRVSLKMYTGEQSSIKASYSHTAQNLHLVSNTISASPLDMWSPSSYNISPEVADQFSGGFFRSFGGDMFDLSAELYYRKLYNQIDFIDGAETVLNEFQDADMLFGSGRAYGAEFFVKKTAGSLNGWISYTLSRTERKFEGINNGQYFPAKYDKRHSLSLVAVYKLNRKVTVSGTYSYASGTPVTLPADRFEVQGYPVQYNSGNHRNNFRIPSYQRVDLSATFRNKVKHGSKYNSEWVISLFNALNRRNTFSIYLRQDEKKSSEFQAVRFAMFGTIIPSVTWNFRF